MAGAGAAIRVRAKAGFDEYRRTNDLITENFGVSATPYDGEQLIQLEPALKPGLGGAWHYEGDCHLRPDKLLTEMRKRLESRGVQIVESLPVDQFHREAGRAKQFPAMDERLKQINLLSPPVR